MKKVALTIGINDYKISPLKGCVNDANNIAQVLRNNGYEVIQLLNADATKANIMNKLSTIFNNAVDGDRIFFSYSGHGSYIPSTDSSETDGRTEILCTYDLINANGTWNFQNIIKDDEIFNIISKKPNVIVETLFDSCHSQGSTRDIHPFIIPKYVECPLSKGLPPSTTVTRFNTVKDNNHIIEWSGCKSDQTSADAFINNAYGGAFSNFFFKHLGKPRQDMIVAIQDDIKKAGFTQIPQLTCSTDKLLEKLF